jgi:hypothetical protein
MQAIFPEMFPSAPTAPSLSAIETLPPSPQPFVTPQDRYGAVQRNPEYGESPEQRLTRYYEDRLTQRAQTLSNSAMVDIPDQVVRFVMISVIVVLLCLGVSYFVSEQQVRHCKRMYGGIFATPVKSEVLRNEIKNYLYGD